MKREKYLKNIRGFYETDLIKVITGIRRSGKSIILKQIKEELLDSGVSAENIIYINFEDVANYNIKTCLDLNDYIKSLIKNKKKYYMLFDEIQNVSEFEKTINSLRVTENCSIFITGSNSNLLSGELATLLSGRFVSFKVAPFSFSEVVSYLGLEKKDYDEYFNDFILWGSLPQRYEYKENSLVIDYLSSVFDSIAVKDIIKRNNINDITTFERVLEYIVTNPTTTFSPTKLEAEFFKDKVSVSSKTLYEYLKYAENAYLTEKISTFDIRGKRILTRKDKYYLTDLGLGQILNRNKKLQMGAYLENVVYNELVNSGYTVSIGNNNGKEVDFVAVKEGVTSYYQVTYILTDEEVIKREFGAFDDIKDNYPKYVLSMDKFDFSQNGIIHKNIIEWLLEEK